MKRLFVGNVYSNGFRLWLRNDDFHSINERFEVPFYFPKSHRIAYLFTNIHNINKDPINLSTVSSWNDIELQLSNLRGQKQEEQSISMT